MQSGCKYPVITRRNVARRHSSAYFRCTGNITKIKQKMESILQMIVEMAPYLLLGFLFAGILHVFVPARFYSHYLADGSWRSVVYATLMGIPLPLCSCGVLPTALSLHKEGASKGATAAFLVATPQTGVDSILATYSLMGLPFAILRPIAALVTAMFGGGLVNATEKTTVEQEDNNTAHCATEEGHCCSSHSYGAHCCCHEEDAVHENTQPADSYGAHCCCHKEDNSAALAHESFAHKLLRAVRYGFVDMLGEIGGWLVVGLIIAALITVLVPDDFFTIFAGNTWLSMLLVLLVSVPMYICATGSIPIAVALILKGLSPGTAFVMLMAGPACNIASIVLIRRQLGLRTLMAYLLSIISGAVAFGLIIDYMLPERWFGVDVVKGYCHDEHASWFQIACAAILGIMLIVAFMHKKAKSAHCPCCK